MKRYVCSVIMTMIVCLWSCRLSAQVSSSLENMPENALDAPYVEGELLVRYLSSVSEAGKNEIQAQVGATTLESNFSVPNLELVKLPQGQSVEEAIDYYRKAPGVLYVSPNYIIDINGGMFTPKKPEKPKPKPDPQFDDPEFYKSWGIEKIEAPKVWNQYTLGNRSVIVAVIDTGIDYTHEDVSQNAWKNEKEIPNNGIDDDNNGFIDDVNGYNFFNNSADPLDDNGHGTHVAGTIGAVGGNKLGTIGVNVQVSMMACKFLGSDGRGNTAAAIQAIDYAVANGAKVLNNSWGGGRFSQPLLDAIKAAERGGALFVAAAGNWDMNNEETPLYPASYDASNIISVAATDVDDQKSTFSNWGKVSVDLAAPGTGIFSTLPSNGYGEKSGTSMATPHVSGAAAIIWAHKPGSSLYDVKDMIMRSVDPVRTMRDMTVTGGRLNVYKAFTLSLLML